MTAGITTDTYATCETYHVGRYYRVPSVYVRNFFGYRGPIAVLGPHHEDREIVRFPDWHYHVDWRFAPRLVFDRVTRAHGILHRARYYSTVIICGADGRDKAGMSMRPSRRRLKCKRVVEPFPRDLARWTSELDRAFRCQRLQDGRCPHRGIPVSAMHRDGDVLTCPGHGLRFNALTGEVLR